LKPGADCPTGSSVLWGVTPAILWVGAIFRVYVRKKMEAANSSVGNYLPGYTASHLSNLQISHDRNVV
jgi:hypothetical protein